LNTTGNSRTGNKVGAHHFRNDSPHFSKHQVCKLSLTVSTEVWLLLMLLASGCAADTFQQHSPADETGAAILYAKDEDQEVTLCDVPRG
jgi:hypothetical protein